MTPEMPGRVVQSRIYRNGAFGLMPKVPIDAVELEKAAHRKLAKGPVGYGAYIAASAGQGRTIDNNRTAFDHWEIVPRMLRDVGERDMSVEIFGKRHPSPFFLAPVGVLEMAHPEAELAVARAAASADVPMIISTQGSTPMEKTCAELGGSESWYQLYWSSNDDLVASMVKRAEKSGCTAIVVTLDTHVLGWRTRDLDLGFLPFAKGMGIAQYTSDPVFTRLVEERAARPASGNQPRPTLAAIKTLIKLTKSYPGSFWKNLRSPLPRAAVETFLDVFSRSTLTWENLASLRELTDLPILLKGLQHPDDAALALEHGVDGIVVSNHGGRQVDGAIGSLDALVPIVETIAGRIPVLFDSGIRSGGDAFKAIALGADAVLIGRPYVCGLVLAGEDGVREVIDNFKAEFDLTMALTGCASIRDVTPELLVPARR